MKILFIILITLIIFSSPATLAGDTYEFSYKITGDAKGRILIIFPYRVFYTADASLLFSATPDDKGNTLFKLTGVEKTGFMMRTLGFSGRSLAVLTADNNKTRGKSKSTMLKNGFPQRAPEYSKFIRKYYWNNFIFKRTIGTITFLRDGNGISRNLMYKLWLKRSSGEKPVKINFGIYRIMGEAIKAFNHSFLPENTDISMLEVNPQRKWTSEDIDFSNILAQSALYSAGIFRKIKPLKQEKPFRVNYSSSLFDNSYLIIKGSAKPYVSVFKSFKIINFSREVKIRLKDHLLIYDSIIIDVYDKTGKGGRLKTNLILKK
ncbi:MAG: hypothetical protein KAS97_03690 [Candidatus Aminicenantes bacterium]|nr:hypothetical protein [Candidatus Aminicenantes bacterium]